MTTPSKEKFFSNIKWFSWPNLISLGLFLAAVTNLIIYEMTEDDPPVDTADLEAPHIPEDIPNTPNTKLILITPFRDFVMSKNAELIGDEELARYHRRWDSDLFEAVTKLSLEYAKTKTLYTDMARIAEDYAYVIEELRAADLPEVFAALPLVESRYRNNKPKAGCGAGKWNIRPEKAVSMALKVKGCPIIGKNEDYSPSSDNMLSPEKSSYSLFEDKKPPICLLETCVEDERLDFELSTKASINTLQSTLNHPELKTSGSAVQIAILSLRRSLNESNDNNLVTAYKQYLAKPDVLEGTSFIGDNLSCGPIDPTKWESHIDKCGGVLQNQDQDLVAKVIAQHLIVVCRLAKEHSETPAFEPWLKYLGEGQYCEIVE